MACAANRLSQYEKEFVTKLWFGFLWDDEWRTFKDPQVYDALAESNSGAYEDLKRLYFLVQRAPLEFAADHSAKALHVFVGEIRKVIEAKHRVLPAIEGMQVLTRADAAPFLSEVIPEALAASVI